ncbi:MAG: S9 family peptidase [Acidobacteriota bacterium]|nr:S9 family peptidase [Acidobacteriota bacterium]
MRWFVVPLALMVLPVAPAADADRGQDKRAWTIEDLYRVEYPGQIQVSPDGRTVLYRLVRRDLRAGKSNADIYRIPLDGGAPRRLTTTDEVSESFPVWSPDGKTIAFVADRGGGEQVWLLPADGGEARALTDLSTGAAHLRWSPDGKTLVFTSTVDPRCGADDACHRRRDELREAIPLEVHIADDLLFRHWDSWSDGRVTHLLAVDVNSGDVRDLTPGEKEAPTFFGGPAFDLSPDGAQLVYTRNPDPYEELAWSTNSDIWEAPLAARASPADGARNLSADNPAFDGHPHYSPDGRWLAYLRHRIPGYESDLPRLILLDRQSGERRVLAGGFDFQIQAMAWKPDSSGLVFTAAVGGRTPLYVVDLESGAPRLVADFAHIDELQLTPDGRRAVVVRRAVAAPPEIWVLALDAAAPPRRLTHHNQDLEQEVDIRPAERIWVEGPEGRRIEVFVIKPHGFDPARKYPLIFNVHGGPQYQWSDAFRGDWQVYPGAGYVVAFANPTGSLGYGQEFTAAISGDWGGRVYHDLMAVVDHLERLPWIDGERVGAMGWSFGGYMMNWLLGHTDRFEAVASMMGIYDLASFYGGTEELWFPEWDLKGVPWNSGDYRRWNPAAFAREMGRFATPTLIITGEKDFRIPYTQSVQLFTTLRRQGVPARLVVFPQSGHWPGWYEMALYYTAHLEWFHDYLGGEAPPWSTREFAEGRAFVEQDETGD